MKFLKAFIDGYGKFHNREFTLEPGFNLFFGPNEAGKSTLMSFFRAIFFGFPGRRDAFDRYEPLAGGLHGGRVELETTDGKGVSVVLRPGRTLSGEIIVQDGSELSGDKAKRSLQHILHGVSESIYRSVFVFSLTELQRLDTLENDEISAHIYSAGTGVGNVTLPEVLKIVEEKRNTIYKQGGSVQVVPKIIKGLERIRSEISDIKNDQDRYKTTVIEIENLGKEKKGLSHDIHLRRREMERASRLRAGRENVHELNEIEKQLASFSEIKNFPIEGVKRLEKYEETLSEKKEELKECRNHSETVNAQISKLPIVNDVLEAESSITSLINDFSAETENLRRKDEIESNVILLKGEISDAISDLGTDWDEDRVTAVNAGNETLQNIRVLTDQLSDAGVSVEKAENLHNQARRNREESFREFQEQARSLDRLRPTVRLTFFLIFGIPVLILLGIFFGMTYKPLSGVFALMAGFVPIAILYYFCNVLPRAYKKESKEQQMLVMNARERSIEEAEKLLNDARERHEMIVGKWQQWLRNNGFSEGLDRDGIFDLVETIRRVKGVISKRKDAESKLLYVRKRAKTYIDRLNSALNSCNLAPADLDTVSQSIFTIKDMLKKQKILQEAKERLEEKRKELGVQEKTVQTIIQDIEKAIQNLIIQGSAKNTEEFRMFSGTVQRRATLTESKNIIERQLARLIGKPAEVERFKEEVLGETDQSLTDSSIPELENEIKRLEGELSDCMQEMGAKKNQLAELERKERLSELRLEEETLKARLRESMHEWSVSALCYKLLDGAMKIYERERQPFVLKFAGEYFGKITEGRYNRVIKKANDNMLVVETPEGQQKSVASLSKGTAEQLYLSMRLAFIKEYANRAGPLPIIVDDILVNFDPKRAKATLQLINEVAGQHQVVMFTCHPATLQQCRREIKDFKGPIVMKM
ncbi:MAG: AAA family ATPase [Candidatus Scalindua sp.]|nr:AAA family ATPase [Candidatus Scalindua sp.]